MVKVLWSVVHAHAQEPSSYPTPPPVWVRLTVYFDYLQSLEVNHFDNNNFVEINAGWFLLCSCFKEKNFTLSYSICDVVCRVLRHVWFCVWPPHHEHNAKV